MFKYNNWDLGIKSVFADPNNIPNNINHATHIEYRVSNINEHLCACVCACVTLLLQKTYAMHFIWYIQFILSLR